MVTMRQIFFNPVYMPANALPQAPQLSPGAR